MRYITIKDIAHSLNVSVATVSKAFNDRYDIRKETKEMILQKAKELGYKPNPIAKKLLQKHSFNIGVIVPEFIHSFFPEVIIGVQEVFYEKGYQVIIMQSNENAELELANIISLENNMVEGLLISLSKETMNIDYLEHLIKDKFPVVLFNRVNSGLSSPKVLFNDYKWSLFATEHLIEQGYQKIVHLTGHTHLTLVKERIRGFKRAMEKYRCPCEDRQIIETSFSIEGGERAMEALIQQDNIPDAVFATNDLIAIGAMRVSKKHGLKIPKDIGFVGFSNSKMAEVVEPSLTSVDQPTYEMGRTAAMLLLEELTSTGNINPKTIILDGKLVVRESSLNKKKNS
ncbi:MAG: LacI family transcriptional regulator [Chitinophagaceae bacterium]|nr:MAG: LacI family transcriptional regulator [Chitinophagaceae bacterium]